MHFDEAKAGKFFLSCIHPQPRAHCNCDADDLPGSESTKRLDSLDIQWRADQVLILERLPHSLEVVGLEMSIEGRLILVLNIISFALTSSPCRHPELTYFFNYIYVAFLPTVLLKYLILGLGNDVRSGPYSSLL